MYSQVCYDITKIDFSSGLLPDCPFISKFLWSQSLILHFWHVLFLGMKTKLHLITSWMPSLRLMPIDLLPSALMFIATFFEKWFRVLFLILWGGLILSPCYLFLSQQVWEYLFKFQQNPSL